MTVGHTMTTPGRIILQHPKLPALCKNIFGSVQPGRDASRHSRQLHETRSQTGFQPEKHLQARALMTENTGVCMARFGAVW